jgi:hypothetical protein
LRFSVIFSVFLLWVVAMSDGGSHVPKGGSFATAELTAMAVVVCVVALGTIATLNATVPSYWWTGSA